MRNTTSPARSSQDVAAAATCASGAGVRVNSTERARRSGFDVTRAHVASCAMERACYLRADCPHGLGCC